jgi:hypothetical protein
MLCLKRTEIMLKIQLTWDKPSKNQFITATNPPKRFNHQNINPQQATAKSTNKYSSRLPNTRS